MGCRGEGGDWGLPDGITRQRELVGYMEENRVQAVWLGIQREVTPWRWVNGSGKANT